MYTGKVLGSFIDAGKGNSGGPLYGDFGDDGGFCVAGVYSSYPWNPSYSTDGDNEFAGGSTMVELVREARPCTLRCQSSVSCLLRI